MPFRSQAQRRMLFATNPKVAKEFAAATPKGAVLPEKVKPKKKPPGTFARAAASKYGS